MINFVQQYNVEEQSDLKCRIAFDNEVMEEASEFKYLGTASLKIISLNPEAILDIKLTTKHRMNVLDKVLNERLGVQVKIERMHYGFIKGKKNNRCNNYYPVTTGEENEGNQEDALCVCLPRKGSRESRGK